MQFINFVPLVLAASLVQGAPITAEKRMAVGNENYIVPSNGDWSSDKLWAERQRLYREVSGSIHTRDFQDEDLEKRLNVPFFAARVINWLGKIKVSKEALQERDFQDEEIHEFMKRLVESDVDLEEMEKRLNVPFFAARVINWLGKIKVSKEALQERDGSDLELDELEKRLSIPFVAGRVLNWLGKIKVSKEALQERDVLSHPDFDLLGL